MKLRFEIDVPEYEWVDAPLEIWTPLGVFDNEQHVDAICNLFCYIQNVRGIEKIINSDHTNIRAPLCREWVRNRLPFVPKNQIADVGEKLSHWLNTFSEGSGHYLWEYVFEPSVKSTGKKIQFKHFSAMFKNEQEAFRHIAHLYICNSDFKPEVQL